MATPVTFRTAAQVQTAQADAILSKRNKPEWKELLITSMPADIVALAGAAIEAELEAVKTKAALQTQLNDKSNPQPGKRLIVGLGRNPSLDQSGIFIAWVAASAGQTETINFSDFIK